MAGGIKNTCGLRNKKMVGAACRKNDRKTIEGNESYKVGQTNQF